MTEELKPLLPCPFNCGDVSVKYDQGSWGYYPPSYEVSCKKCGCKQYKVDVVGEETDATKKRAMVRAIKNWNTRVNPDTALIEALMMVKRMIADEMIYHAVCEIEPETGEHRTVKQVIEETLAKYAARKKGDV